MEPSSIGQMNSNTYRLLGYVVWNGGKWYLRRRLPSRRKILLTVLAGGASLTAVLVLAKRVSG